MIGVLPVGVAVVEETEGVFEALLVGLSRSCPALPRAPLADDGRAVARIAQHLGDGTSSGRSGISPLPRIHAWPVCSPVINDVRDGAHTVLPA